MKTEELVASLTELIDCYKLVKDPTHNTNQEITMWRKRFLVTQTLPKDEKVKMRIEQIFLSIPCETFCEQNPEDVIQSVLLFEKR